MIGPTVSLTNILLIDLSFLVLIFYNKDFTFLKNKSFKYLIFLYVYLIFNSFISLKPELGIYRNLGFIRIIILFLSINYFYHQKDFFIKVFTVWFLIFSIVIVDVFFEVYFGKNILGYGGNADGRIYSFFKDEAVVGAFMNAFFLILIGFLFEKFKTQKKYLIFLFALIYLLVIFTTGERASGLKGLLGLLFFFVILREFTLRNKIFLVSSLFLSLLTLIYSSDYLKLRFVDQVKFHLSFKENQYYDLYKSGFEVAKKNPLFGVGNRNYRLETCVNNINDINFYCSTHPHQVYFEFLSEHGFLGTIVIFYLLYALIFSKWWVFRNNYGYIQLGTYLYLIFIFLPIIPSGAFFSDFSLTLFAINLSLLYASSPKMNIFSNLNDKD
tara:strand:- start:47 stop:1198 length:1152 start_codon:yes stop_codon:yes gene_type:complete